MSTIALTQPGPGGRLRRTWARTTALLPAPRLAGGASTPRPHRGCDGWPGRAAVGARVRRQLGAGTRGGHRHGCRGRCGGRRLRRQSRPGQRSDRRDDRGPGPDRGGVRSPGRPGGRPDVGPPAGRLGLRRRREVHPRRPDPGGRGVHAWHRSHHRPPAGPGRARSECPRRQGPPAGRRRVRLLGPLTRVGVPRAGHPGHRADVAAGPTTDTPRSPGRSGRRLARELISSPRRRHDRGNPRWTARAPPPAGPLGLARRPAAAGDRCRRTGGAGEPALGHGVRLDARGRAPRPGTASCSGRAWPTSWCRSSAGCRRRPRSPGRRSTCGPARGPVSPPCPRRRAARRGASGGATGRPDPARRIGRGADRNGAAHGAGLEPLGAAAFDSWRRRRPDHHRGRHDPGRPRDRSPARSGRRRLLRPAPSGRHDASRPDSPGRLRPCGRGAGAARRAHRRLPARRSDVRRGGARLPAGALRRRGCTGGIGGCRA